MRPSYMLVFFTGLTLATSWAYRAIYRVGDQRVGQRSKPVSVTVGG
jgi:hypothetical protein